MCGLAGILNLDETLASRTELELLMRGIAHRGPDDSGVFVSDNVGLGFVRLSIIDLSALGHQPMFSEDGDLVLLFNGEIFNYLELKVELELRGVKFRTKTDSEVLLKAYIHWGEECLDKFNGMWSFVIYSIKRKYLFAARDRFGVKPFYYYFSKKKFVFCSEIPPILKVVKTPIVANDQIIYDYLVHSRTDHTERTFFSEIQKLQHGEKLIIEGGVVSIRKWYDLERAVKDARGFSNDSEYLESLTSSIQLRLKSDVPVGVCLSGGLDSSSIVSIIVSKLRKDDLSTFSAIYNQGDVGNESEYINEYRNIVKSMFFTSPGSTSLLRDAGLFIKAHGEPVPTTGPYAQYKVMELARKHVIVTLDGQGADETLGGYHYFYGYYFRELFLRLRLFSLFREIGSYISKHKSLKGLKAFIFFFLPGTIKTGFLLKRANWVKASFSKKYCGSNVLVDKLYSASSLRKALLYHFEYKLEHLLKWEDRNSMVFSIEARVPFLDYRLVERTLATAPDLIIRNGTTKFILREALIGLLPEKIRQRRDKIGFGSPSDEWFRSSEWKEFIYNLLASESFSSRGYICNKKALLLYSKHLEGRINIANDIWKWINLELWFREFIDPFAERKKVNDE
ncbi:MAG: asparagine synthase (glutamine-hydrolyzing) [Bacteroidia bacterium]|nr:asparagine synthase (glutamine-hydrolyzing) [Bacteroidia bacterium]